MYALDDSTTFIAGPFGWLIKRCKPSYCYVYLLHFDRPFGNLSNPRGQARHYLGSTCDLDHRLQLHRTGQGARLLEVVTAAGISFEVCRLWRFNTIEEARTFEKKLKHQHNGLRLCPLCQHKPVDSLVSMRQGHWPFHLFSHQGKRRPMINS